MLGFVSMLVCKGKSIFHFQDLTDMVWRRFSYITPSLKGIVHPKKQILSSTHPREPVWLTDCLLWKITWETRLFKYAKFDVRDVERHHVCHVTKYVSIQSLACDVKFCLKYGEQLLTFWFVTYKNVFALFL